VSLTQCNRILALINTLCHSLELNLRRGQSLGEDGVVALREGTSKIMHLKMLLKRSQGRATVNFDRDLIPY